MGVVENLLVIGEWSVDQAANTIRGPGGTIELEPRVMDLLILLAARAGDVLSKDEIAEELWGDIHVNEDALTRSVFKLRKALGDDARNPKYIATVSKRGYRLIAKVEMIENDRDEQARAIRLNRALLTAVPVILIVALLSWTWLSSTVTTLSGSDPQNASLSRADGFYSQYTRTDNEAALRLYESILDQDPKNAAALAGLANALTQRIIRYQGLSDGEPARVSLTEALESGWLDAEEAQSPLQRATGLARRASETDPSHDRAWRALGLALSAQQDFSAAERAYERALVIDPDDWGTMINLSELYELTNRQDRSTPYLAQAWFAMERRYEEESVSIRPWHSAIGIFVASAEFEAGKFEESRLWYRRVLARDPLNAEAVRGLSQTLKQLGDDIGAEAVCRELATASEDRC
ncbi:MAG: winged helix-turn-helix domain-containing protein [Pseudomonadota bacterium]